MSETDVGSTLLVTDEVDQTGAHIPEPGMLTEEPENVPAEEPVALSSSTDGLQESKSSPGDYAVMNASGTVRITPRPQLRREGSTPAPPPQPRSTAEEDGPADSLSLAQLKKLVNEMPKIEPAAYAFKYEDMACMEEELDDLFGYSEDERSWLLRCQAVFAQRWQDFIRHEYDTDGLAYETGEIDWRASDAADRVDFLKDIAENLFTSESVVDLECLECLIYVALGCWNETAGHDEINTSGDCNQQERTKKADDVAGEQNKYINSQTQIQCTKENVHLIVDTVGTNRILKALISSYNRKPRQEDVTGLDEEPASQDYLNETKEALRACLTLTYLIVDVAVRDDATTELSIRDRIVGGDSNLLRFLTDWLVRSRWAPHGNTPGKKLLLLYWKTILLYFGKTQHLQEIAQTLSPLVKTEDDLPQITASPLDYHLFRQEIISKYPAFNPPQPVFPYEPEHTSFLPPFDESASRPFDESRRSSMAGPAMLNGVSASIFHEPVHIATPAPSPPPTPALGPGGKSIKKQNYQTNQMFPLLYPPLEESSNKLGGKGTTALQDALAGRKWQGSDVPASILEAATLFSSRMRATRAMRQLWQEREHFLKHERGVGEMNLEEENNSQIEADEDADLKDLNTDLRDRLLAVEDFYQYALPSLQSLVYVLLRVPQRAATTLATSLAGTAESPDGLADIESASRPGTSGGELADNVRLSSMSVHELNSLRGDEIGLKAMSAIVFLLMRWFKASHVLKFEYLSQLLLDSNYIQFTMKLFTHQELERTVSYRRERKDLNFLEFCKAHSRHHMEPNHQPQSDKDKDKPSTSPQPTNLTSATGTFIQPAAPPPLTTSTPTDIPPPEVDELGLPTAPLPPSPITTYSWLTFFTTLNHLRTLLKLLSHHPHRHLMMVHGKHTATLKRCLKVPQPDIRYYTLKIIKGQVPYYHRKWRQSNMRVITAIYLYVKPGLRDEWLSQSGEGEGEGENSLAMERAVRSLAFWYNVRRYPDEMGMVKQEEGLEGEALRGLTLTADVANEEGEGDGEVDPNDDDVNPLDLGAPPSPPPELEVQGQQVTPESTVPGFLGPDSSASTTNINTETTSTPNSNTTITTTNQPPSSATTHTRTSSTTSTTSSTSRLLTQHAPDFFTQELERMSLTKDPKTGFWSRSAPTPIPAPSYSPYTNAEQVRQEALVQATQQQVAQGKRGIGDGNGNVVGRQQTGGGVKGGEASLIDAGAGAGTGTGAGGAAVGGQGSGDVALESGSGSGSVGVNPVVANVSTS